MVLLFNSHPEWKPNGSAVDRKIKVDMEASYQSAEFAEYYHSLSYCIVTSPTRDKHGIAERSVGNIVTKANVAMLGNINNPCPQQFWPDAIEYSCHSDGFRFKNKIGTSPYFYMKQRHVHLKYLHPFWTPVYFTIPPNERIGGKLGVARAHKGYFVGYSYSKFLQPCYKVVARYSNGTFGHVRHTKDVIFDNFHSVDDNDLPSEQEFNIISTLELVSDVDNADALRRQLILPPALPIAPTTDVPDPEPPPDTDIPLPDPFIPEAPDPHNEIGSTYDEVGNILY